MSDTHFESIDETVRGRFESAWANGQPIAIESILTAKDDPRYVGTLEELIHIELEFAWKQHQASTETRTLESQATLHVPTRVEDYLARFPDLNKPDIVLRLVQQEFLVRSRHGDRPPAEEYQSRFPQIVESAELLSDDIDESHPVGGAIGDEMHAGDSLDRYLLVEEHGRGGFGCVWRADDPKLRRRIALKQLSRSFAANEEQRRRFVNEARITARLEHPGIVPIYDLGELEADQPYYTMKLVGGQTLNEAIDRFHQKRLSQTTSDRAVRQLRLLNVFLSVCQTIEYAHSHHVVHRDLKPQNIIVGEYGETVVLDWGLAKSLRVDEGSIAVNGEQVATVLIVKGFLVDSRGFGF